MKSIVFIGLFFITFFSASALVNQPIKVPKENKVESTFSGDLDKNESFHLIFTKHKKTKEFQVFYYLYDGKNTSKVGILNSEQSYSFVSFHKNDNILSVFMSFKIKKENYLKRIDVNILTNEIIEGQPINHENFKCVIRKKSKSIFIYKDDKRLLIRQFFDSGRMIDKEMAINSEDDEIAVYFKDLSISSINTDEFIANGSTSMLRVYLINDEVVFTKENEKENETSVLKISLINSEQELFLKTFINRGDKLKKSTSFVTDNRLYQLAIGKKSGYIKIWEITNSNELNHIILDEALSSSVISTNQFEGIAGYLKQASRKTHIPTIAVNETENSLFVLRVDYVDMAYSYGYNWWFHHQMMWNMQMQMQQQQMINSVPNFGPSLNDYYFNSYIVNDDNRYFELLIDVDGIISNQSLQSTIHNEVDKKSYIDKLEDVKGFKFVSSCFLKDSFRFIAYSKSSKNFIIQTNPLK